MRKPDPLRIYAARREGNRHRLLGQGVGEAAAEQWLVAWEAEGRSRAIDATTAAFWEEGYRWIAEQRKGRRTPQRAQTLEA
jgi:hypothetical protein